MKHCFKISIQHSNSRKLPSESNKINSALGPFKTLKKNQNLSFRQVLQISDF